MAQSSSLRIAEQDDAFDGEADVTADGGVIDHRATACWRRPAQQARDAESEALDESVCTDPDSAEMVSPMVGWLIPTIAFAFSPARSSQLQGDNAIVRPGLPTADVA
jgi:hypothetical protein